jgi:hypothetical protein
MERGHKHVTWNMLILEMLRQCTFIFLFFMAVLSSVAKASMAKSFAELPQVYTGVDFAELPQVFTRVKMQHCALHHGSSQYMRSCLQLRGGKGQGDPGILGDIRRSIEQAHEDVAVVQSSLASRPTGSEVVTGCSSLLYYCFTNALLLLYYCFATQARKW